MQPPSITASKPQPHATHGHRSRHRCQHLGLGACLTHRPAGQVIFKLDAESGALTKHGDPITIEGKPRCVKFGVLPTS